ncbi:hypothetical protein PM082_020035 [Marasmius tenuissimus]|nr:hypothetical protein PM082_020035 [Marasmius tenuissimus]
MAFKVRTSAISMCRAHPFRFQVSAMAWGLYLVWQVILTLCVTCAIRSFSRRWVARRALNKIPGPRPSSWIKGSFNDIFGPDGWDFHAMMRTKYGPTSTFSSVLGEKYIYTFDAKAMHHILVKEQSIFEEQPVFIATNKLVFGDGLLSTLGDHHRKQRKMLNPLFSIAHMRNMVPIFHDIAKKLRSTIAKKVSNRAQELDMLSWMSRTALELIGQAGLGYSFDSLTDEGSAHPYAAAMKEVMPLIGRTLWARVYFLHPFVGVFSPRILRIFATYLPIAPLQRGKELSDYMWSVSTEIYYGKLRALDEGDNAVCGQVGKGKDIIGVLMKEYKKASDHDNLDELELIGQMSTLIFAATDTTSNALSRIIHLLSQHLDVQTKLREEIRAARIAQEGKDIPYDELVCLPLLDAICRETLRLYAPIPRVLRMAKKDTVVPLSTPVRCTDGSLVSEILVPANTNVYISILNSNRNIDLWGPDALEWKPERWLSPLPSAICDARIPGVYSHLMTFIGGGRSCIGFKFSQLEMKVVLYHLVEMFEFAPSGKEIYWENNVIANPTVKTERGHFQMPLKVSLASQDV